MIHDHDYPIEGNAAVLSDLQFDSSTTSFNSFQLQSSDVFKHQYSFDSLFPPVSYELFLSNNAVSQTVPSIGRLDFFRRHGTTEGEYETKLDDSTETPNLFRPLQEEQLTPTPEDMEPSNIDLTPGEQELRFEGDVYTPRYVRGHGPKREGWCGICKPGRWLVLKNSAFWYDKSFTHGISAASGMAFDGPKKTRRMSGNSDVWEGLCGSCDGWIALISSKKKGTTWFRHAYKVLSNQVSILEQLLIYVKISAIPIRNPKKSPKGAVKATNTASPDPLARKRQSGLAVQPARNLPVHFRQLLSMSRTICWTCPVVAGTSPSYRRSRGLSERL